MNKYSPDGNFIFDEIGRKYAVDTPHPLPLPKGINISYDLQMAGEADQIIFGGDCGGAYTKALWGQDDEHDTHWLARRPLPPVPRRKTQEELDGEACSAAYKAWDGRGSSFDSGFYAGIAHARKEGK